jgi:hypothetical protein
MVAEKVVRKVPYTVCKPVRYEQTVPYVRWVPKQVSYTVTRCVPKVVYKEVPVTVCCRVPCCRRCPRCCR